MKKECAAPDCEKEFLVKMPHAMYCSNACRYRTSKRKKYEERLKSNLCPQCGGDLNKVGEQSYCGKCVEYFKNRYYKTKKTT